MPIVDAQIHIWEEETPRRPWPEGGRARAHRTPPLSAGEVLDRMDREGVERAVLVPPTFAGDQNDVCLAAARAHPDRFAVMGQVSLDPVRGSEELRHWRERPGMLGVRITLSRGASQNWIRDHTLDWFWAAAEEAEVPVYVLPPGLADQIALVARRHPGLRLIIDHLGIRTGLRDDAILPAIDDVLTLAALPNVAVKASCLPSYVSEPYPFPTLQGIVRRVVTEFGPARVFWGSDLSRLTCSYREAIDLFTKELDFVQEDALELIMGRAIAEWLRW